MQAALKGDRHATGRYPMLVNPTLRAWAAKLNREAEVEREKAIDQGLPAPVTMSLSKSTLEVLGRVKNLMRLGFCARRNRDGSILMSNTHEFVLFTARECAGISKKTFDEATCT